MRGRSRAREFVLYDLPSRKVEERGAWETPLVNPTLGFGSGRDPRVVGLSPVSGSALSMEPA